MSYTVPNLDDLHGFLIAFWKAMFPKSNVGSRFSYHWKRLRAYAGGVTDVHAGIKSAQSDVMPDTSQGDFLTRWGKITGVQKKSATPARGTKALRVTGIVGSTATIGDTLLHVPTGYTFQITETAVIPAGLYIDVDVAGISTGSATRLDAGEQLQFQAPGVGITALAKLVKALDQDGFDAEQDPAYSVRVNDQLGKPRTGGSQDDFAAWIEQVTGIAHGYCYPNRAGIGTVDLVGLHDGDGSARSLTSPEMTAALQRVTGADGLADTLGAAPVQVAATNGSLRMLTTVADEQDVEITYQTNGDIAYAFDWNDNAGAAPVVVLAYTTATREVQATAALPLDLQAGARFVTRGVGSVQDGQVFTVETVTAADKFIIRETPGTDLAATDQLYAAGPLTALIRDAIVAHMNGEIVYANAGNPVPASKAGSLVGLDIIAEGIGPANPGGIYGPWSGSIVRAVLNGIAVYAKGVRNVGIVTPAADYDATDPTFPNDDTINFIAPRAVLVRGG